MGIGVLFSTIRKKLSSGVSIGRFSTVDKDSKIQGPCCIGNSTNIRESFIGRASYCGNNCDLHNIEIGNYCSIGDNVCVVSGRHPVDEFLSSSPVFYSTKKQANITYSECELYSEYDFVRDRYSVVVGNDVWIGSHVKILEGVSIGDGAILAAGAVVAASVEPYAIVGGVPAKLIRYRFPEDTRTRLMTSEWWNLSDAQLRELAPAMNDIGSFMDKMNEIKQRTECNEKR